MRIKKQVVKNDFKNFDINDFSTEEIFTLKSLYSGPFAVKIFESIGEEGVQLLLGYNPDIAV